MTEVKLKSTEPLETIAQPDLTPTPISQKAATTVPEVNSSITSSGKPLAPQSRSRRRSSTSSRSRSQSPYKKFGRYRRSRSRSRDYNQRGRLNHGERRRSSLTPPYHPRPYGRQPRGRSPRGYVPRRNISDSREFGDIRSKRQRWNPSWMNQRRRSRQRYSPPPTRPTIQTNAAVAVTVQPESPGRLRVSTDINPPPPEMLTLTERFQSLVNKAEARRTEYGIPGGYAHLVLTNRLKMPLPTLMRQAKELSVVIERELPSDIANPSEKIIFDFDHRRAPLVLHHNTNQKTKPVFDRPEIPIYTTPKDEDVIISRLAAFMSAHSGESVDQHPMPNRPTFESGNGSFPGFNQKKVSALSRIGSINPHDIPKGPSYFLHDDRDAPRSYRGRQRGGGGGYNNRDDWRQWQDSRDFDRKRSRQLASPDARRKGPVRQEDRWKHDKFLELANNDKPLQQGNGNSPSPRISHSTSSEVVLEEDVHMGAEPQVCDD